MPEQVLAPVKVGIRDEGEYVVAYVMAVDGAADLRVEIGRMRSRMLADVPGLFDQWLAVIECAGLHAMTVAMPGVEILGVERLPRELVEGAGEPQ